MIELKTAAKSGETEMISPHRYLERWEARNLPWLDTGVSSLEALHGELDEAVDGIGLQKQSQMLDYPKASIPY